MRGAGLKPAAKEVRSMGISLSLLLIAIGAVLAWAVNAEVTGIDVQTAGVILVVVGSLGLVISLFFWSTWGGFGNRGAGGGGQNTTFVERDPRSHP
jgi:hypothetical protein